MVKVRDSLGMTLISELLPDMFNILLQGGLVVSGSLPLVRDTNVRTAAHLLVTICVSYNLYTQLYSFTGLIPRIHEVWEWDGSTYYIVLYNCFLQFLDCVHQVGGDVTMMSCGR